jgi:hypothetical protein
MSAKNICITKNTYTKRNRQYWGLPEIQDESGNSSDDSEENEVRNRLHLDFANEDDDDDDEEGTREAASDDVDEAILPLNFDDEDDDAS